MLFTFVRVTTFLVACKSIFPANTPNTFKVMLGLMLSVMISVNLNISVGYSDMYMVVSYSVMEFVNGLFLGFVTYVALNIVQVAGSLIDTQMGLSMSRIYDAQNGAQSTLIQNLFYWIMVLLFFITNGHHLLINGLVKSFEIIPIGSMPIVDNIQYVITIFVEYFSVAFQIALPILLTLIMSDLILGLISRSVPQLNVMIIGMPLKMLIGIIILLVSLSFIGNEMEKIISDLPGLMNGYR
jgi:flagellar biosynthetic protein FliR/FlhB